MNCDVKIDLALKMHSETFTKCIIISLISISTIHTRKWDNRLYYIGTVPTVGNFVVSSCASRSVTIVFKTHFNLITRYKLTMSL